MSKKESKSEKPGSNQDVSCRFCRYFKEDSEYADSGTCQNKEVQNMLMASFCMSFLIDADFGCKFFEKLQNIK